MSDDLEAEIRDALQSRAQTVTADDVRRGDEPRSSSRRNLLAALATAAVVAALAVGIGVAVWPSSHDTKQPPATVSAGGKVIGIKWQFERGINGTTTFSSPGPRVSISFYPQGKFGGDDGVNGLGGRYHIASGGLVIFSDTFSTAVGYAGRDRNVIATQMAFAVMTGGRAAPTAHVKPNGELVLAGPGYTLWFRNAGPAWGR